VYSYCRWADDLADETGDSAKSLALLGWWETQLRDCYRGKTVHPVFVALKETVKRFKIPIDPFVDLLVAFRQDQRVTRYDSIDQLLEYCRYLANPVGRLVLHLGECFSAERARLADSICTGLQLANFCQGVARDWERGRIYLPRTDCHRFGFSEASFAKCESNGAFRRLLAVEVEQAELVRQLARQLSIALRLRLTLVIGRLRGPARLRKPRRVPSRRGALRRLPILALRGLRFGRRLLRVTWLLVLTSTRARLTHTPAGPAPPTVSVLPGIDRHQLALPPPLAYDVIILPVIDWDFRFQRPQQLALRFARAGHRVFYVRTTFTEGESPLLRRLDERIFEVQLPAPAPLIIYRESMSAETVATCVAAFGQLRRRWNLLEAVCLVDLPFWGPLALALREQFGWKTAYDCMDHHAGFSTNTPHMLYHEERLSRASDLVVTTSRILYTEQTRLNPNTLLIPNAADFDHFRFVPSAAPDELLGLTRPIVGYYGAISDWFDCELVRDLALARPHWNFVLIGRTAGADIHHLADLANVHVLSEQPYGKLPPFLKAFDTCIIPFKKTPLTEATNPVKVFEFLSAGKSVVATRLLELEQFGDQIELVSTTDEWLARLEHALGDYGPDRVAARFAFARDNTWERRAEALRQAIRGVYDKVSVVVVTYNNIDYNRLCLDSLLRHTLHPNVEIIVVDNASTDGTRELLQSLAGAHPTVTVIARDTNEGFSRANNIGLSAATGAYLVLLNNDTIVTAGWLGRLLRHLRDPSVGMVGPVTNFSGNESCIPVTYRNLEELEAFAAERGHRHQGRAFDIEMLAFFCAALRRSTLEAVGPLDERFGVGMFEDDDYAVRLKKAGFRLVCAEDTFIHHWGRASFGQFPSQRYLELFEENRARFESKWEQRWTPHQARDATV
jgi:squalene synthase HpnC